MDGEGGFLEKKYILLNVGMYVLAKVKKITLCNQFLHLSFVCVEEGKLRNSREVLFPTNLLKLPGTHYKDVIKMDLGNA